MKFEKKDVRLGWGVIIKGFRLMKEREYESYRIIFNKNDHRLCVDWGHLKDPSGSVLWTITAFEIQCHLLPSRSRLRRALPVLKESFKILKALKNLKEVE
jgi:hypothetical protein